MAQGFLIPLPSLRSQPRQGRDQKMNMAALNKMRDTKACGTKSLQQSWKKEGTEQKGSSWPNRQLVKVNRTEMHGMEILQVNPSQSNCKGQELHHSGSIFLDNKEVHLLLPKPGTGPHAHILLMFSQWVIHGRGKRYSEGHYCQEDLDSSSSSATYRSLEQVINLPSLIPIS